MASGALIMTTDTSEPTAAWVSQLAAERNQGTLVCAHFLLPRA